MVSANPMQSGVNEPQAGVSVAEAKAGLMRWSEEVDARAVAHRSGSGFMLASGAAAVVAGLLTARLVSGSPRGERATGRARPEARVLGWAVAVRMGMWLIPLAIRWSRQFEPKEKG